MSFRNMDNYILINSREMIEITELIMNFHFFFFFFFFVSFSVKTCALFRQIYLKTIAFITMKLLVWPNNQNFE